MIINSKRIADLKDVDSDEPVHLIGTYDAIINWQHLKKIYYMGNHDLGKNCYPPKDVSVIDDDCITHIKNSQYYPNLIRIKGNNIIEVSINNSQIETIEVPHCKIITCSNNKNLTKIHCLNDNLFITCSNNPELNDLYIPNAIRVLANNNPKLGYVQLDKVRMVSLNNCGLTDIRLPQAEDIILYNNRQLSKLYAPKAKKLNVIFCNFTNLDTPAKDILCSDNFNMVELIAKNAKYIKADYCPIKNIVKPKDCEFLNYN